MATSPPVLGGAPSSSSPASVPAPPPVGAKVPIFSLLIAVVMGAGIAAVGVGGGVYYLVHTGRLPMQGAATQKIEAVALTSTHALVLEPLLVNLADPGDSSYLRVALTLRV